MSNNPLIHKSSDMAPLMPFDLSRYEGGPISPPIFPFAMPAGVMGGVPIPPPPAPQPVVDSTDYEMEMAAMANEMMQQGAYNQQAMMPQFPVQPPPHMPPQAPPPAQPTQESRDEEEAVDPYMAAEIASVVHTLTSSQLTYALAAFKIFFDNSPRNAKRLLVNNPQLVYALLHAQYVLGNADTLMLPLNELDTKLANLNRRERELASRTVSSKDGGHYLDTDPRLRSNNTTVSPTVDSAASSTEMLKQTEEPRIETMQQGFHLAETKRSRSRQHRETTETAQIHAETPYDDHNARGVPDHEEDVMNPQEHTQAEMPMYAPPPERESRSPRPYKPQPPPPPPTAPNIPLPPPDHISAALRTIEDIKMEVQPAPPILVDEVLKNTEILTNIQMATLVEMQTWPPEQRLQVLSIKLALHLRGIPINL